MKKFSLVIFSLMLLFVGGFTISSGATFAEEPSEELIEVTINDERDFIDKLSLADNYSGKRLVLTQSLNFSNIDMSAIYANNYVFSGEFDGNGYSISNITISSSGNNYGLFSETDNALIHNLKLDGKITFKFNNSPSEVFAGALVGHGELTTIQNCQISKEVSFQTYTVDGNLEYVQFSSKATFGSFAGCLENGSMIENSINLASTLVDENLSSSTTVKYGGIAGRLFNSSTKYCVNYGDLTYNGRNTAIEFYNGGVVGEVEGSTARVINCAFNGNIKAGEMENLANGVNGAIIGRILDNSPSRGNISFDYFTKTLDAFGKSSYEVVSESHIRKIDSLSLQFFTDQSNWHTLYPAWNFDTIWLVDSSAEQGTTITLQCFENFEFSASSQLDTGLVIKDAYFTGGIASGDKRIYRYNDDVILTFNFQDTHKGYYELRQVLLNSNVLASGLYESEAISNIQGQILGYKIKTKASNLTAGTYSFTLRPITFECEVETEDIAKGDVRYRGGSNGSEKLNVQLTYASAPQTIVATAKLGSVYTFDHWDLYYYGAQGWELSQSRFSSNTNLEIDFGTPPFNQRFKLIAYFTDELALNVSFSKDNNIESIKFSGIDFENEAIKVSSSANVELIVVTKPHFQLSEQRFIDSIANMYGEQGSVDNLVRSKDTDESTGVTTYVFMLNMRYIDNFLAGAKDLTLYFFSEEVQNEGESNLLWLWIVLPIAGVLIIGGIVVFIVIRNYRYKHGAGKFGGVNGGKNKGKGGKEEKAKKPDFKDFYY